MIDTYGREISITEGSGVTTYSAPGITLTFPSDYPLSRVLDTFGAMAPTEAPASDPAPEAPTQDDPNTPEDESQPGAWSWVSGAWRWVGRLVS